MKDLRLVNKLKRRKKSVQSRVRQFDRYDKMDLSEERMSRSQRLYSLLRKVQRRLDRAFGTDFTAQEPQISKRSNILTVERHDFGGSNFGIRLTMASGLIAGIGVRPNDIVKFLSGTLKGHSLKVLSVVDSTHLRLEDDSALNYAGAKEVTEVDCVADVAASLDGSYFLINSAANATAYYVWIDVDAGGNDPAPVGKTPIHVSISSNDSANAVAAAVQAAVDASADFSATVDMDAVTITNAAVGVATDAADNDTGFAISTLTQGAAANPSVSESNKIARFNLSDVKASYK